MLSHLRRRIGVFAAIAVCAALVPALSTSVASAAPNAATSPAPAADVTALKACPASASTPAAGFTDTTSTDVDCIAYYGITTGVTATTYEPTASIPRWQMALYLTRTMDVAGLTLGSGADQGFTDIGGYSAAIQTAINQIKQAGVTTGKTATTYAPDDNVTREEMTMFLTRALAITPVGQNGSNDADALGLTLYINGSTGTYMYTDIDAGVTWEGHNTIIEAYNLGITGDAVTVTTFNPSADITRADMATWLTNALAHTKARPEGLHMQATDHEDFGEMKHADNDEVHISHRDASFDAIANTSVDVMAFYDDPLDTTDLAVSATTGKCDDMVTAQSSTACTIDVGDQVTNAKGDIVLEGSAMGNGDADVDDGETVQYWAWTGANGTVYDSTQTTSTITIVSTTDAVNLTVASSQKEAQRTADPRGLVNPTGGDDAATDVNLDGVADWDDAGGNAAAPHDNGTEAPYGATITLTFQAKDNSGAAKALDKNVSKALELITLTDAYGQWGAQPTAITTTKLYTGADGSVTYDVVCGADPATAAGNESYRRITWISSTLVESDLIAAEANGSTEEWFICHDEAATAHKSKTVIADMYKSVTLAAALTPVTSTVTGTLYDQFGNPVANQAVVFDSSYGATDAAALASAAEGLLDDTIRTTNASGQASASLSRATTSGAAETVLFCVDNASDGCDAGADIAESSDTIYWTNAIGDTKLDPTANYDGSAADTEIQAAIVVGDLANDTLVVTKAYDANGAGGALTATVDYVTVAYDSTDQFSDLSATPTGVTMAAFEAAVAVLCPLVEGCTTGTGLGTTGELDHNAVAASGAGGVSVYMIP